MPDGTTSGISRKLPDTERNRLKTLLKEIVPDTAGVIVRTAAEGASEDELTRDVERLKARWEDIEAKTKGSAPQLLYGEPDLTLKVVRDLFTEDFGKLVIQGQDAWDTVQGYVAHVAPDLEDRLERYDAADHQDADLFAAYRVDEQIAKGLDRKVWLPSGGSLVIDRTEAMTVVDVNTGKFTGSGGNLEETVTKNNLEAAEEVVRQLRLRDIGGIIVVDFIDMVLESNRDLVLRRHGRVPRPGPHPAPGRRGHLARPGPDDPQADRHRPARGVQRELRPLRRPRPGAPRHARRAQGRRLRRRLAPRWRWRRRWRRRRWPTRPGPRSWPGRRRRQRQRQRRAPAVPSPKDVAAMAREHAHDDAAETSARGGRAEAEVVEPVETPAAGRWDRARWSSPSRPPQPTQPPSREPEPRARAGAAEPEPEPEPEAETPDVPPAPPEPPKVVTRTRRRGGTRTAGNATVAADVPESAEAAAIDAALGVPPQDGLVEPGHRRRRARRDGGARPDQAQGPQAVARAFAPERADPYD